MSSKSQLFLLLLVGADTKNLRSSLTALQPFISGWVALDAGSGNSHPLIESCFPGVPGTFAARPWKGEVENRMELLKLTPPGDGRALLLDSSMSVRVEDESLVSSVTSNATEDYLLTRDEGGTTPQWRCLIFPRSLGSQMEVVHEAFVKVDESERAMKLPGLVISRPHSRAPFHSFSSAEAFVTLAEKYVSGGKIQLAINLLEGALSERLSTADLASIHVQLARTYAGQSQFAESFLQYSNAFIIETTMYAEVLEAVVMLNIARQFRLADSLLEQYLFPTGSQKELSEDRWTNVSEWQVSLEAGVAKHGLGDTDSARELFDSIVSNPNSPEVYRKLALSNLDWC